MVEFREFRQQAEKKLHDSAIRRLALEFGVAEESIRDVYEAELAKLLPTARIKDYLSIFVMRRVRDGFRKDKENEGNVENYLN